MEDNKENTIDQEQFYDQISMDKKSRISILSCDDSYGLRNALKDLITLSGVLKDLGNERFWAEPKYVLETMRTFNLILKGTHYVETDGIAGAEELVYRYEREYGEAAEIDIPRLVRLCRKFNWVVDAANGCVKFTSDGKRMVLSLFRIANDSLDFHLTPLEMKYLYLAQRDIDLASVYEDKGIGEHDTLSSIVTNLEDAVEDIERQGQMYIDGGYGLEKFQGVYGLLKRLEQEIELRYNEKRLEAMVGIESQRLQKLYYRSFLAFQKAFRVLAPFLGSIGYASQFGMGRKVQLVDRETFLNYLVDVFSGHVENYIMDPIMVLEQLEFDVTDHADEDMDVEGIFCGFTLPPVLYQEDIEAGIMELDDWITNWSIPETYDEDLEIEYLEATPVTPEQFRKLVGGATAEADSLRLDTWPLVEGIKKYSGDYVDNLLKYMGKEWWQCVVNLSMLAVLHGEREVQLLPGTEVRKDKDLNKEWVLRYPADEERFIRSTAKLGKHLEGRDKSYGG
jgi:hypothetical protein